MEEWQAMTPSEREIACQIPDNVLKSISTLGLIRIFIDKPGSLVFALSASSSSRLETWNRIHQAPDILELIRRKDAAKSLIEYYGATNTDCIIQKKDYELELRSTGLEYLFIQPTIHKQLNQKQKIEVVKMLLKNYRLWQDKWSRHQNDIITVMVWMMYEDMAPYFEKQTLDLIKSCYSNMDLADKVLEFAENYLKN